MLIDLFEKALGRAERHFFPLYSWRQRKIGFQPVEVNKTYPIFSAPSGEIIDAKKILAELVKYGVSAVPNFMPFDAVDSLRNECLSLEEASRENLELRKYGIFGKSFGYENAEQEGVARLYHVEYRVPNVRSFSEHPFLSYIAKEYYNRPTWLETTIFQKNVITERGTRGWHIDSWLNQFKAFLYLSDVTEENGPFTYLLGSHKNDNFLLKKTFRSMRGEEDTGVDEDSVRSSGLEIKKFSGKRGTLLLADTKGIHRGGALLQGTRSAIVNYYYVENNSREQPY